MAATLGVLAPDPISRWGCLALALGGGLLVYNVPPWLKPAVAVGSLAAALVVVGVTAAGALPSPFSNQIVLTHQRHDALGVLANRVRARSMPRALFLVPPFIPDFKFTARRAVVVDFKCFPYTDRGIGEWSSRMSAVYGTGDPVTTTNSWIRDPVTTWDQRSGDDLVEVARRYGAGYLLTRAQWHEDVPAALVDREGGWRLYKVPTVASKKGEAVP
jgi:hypothetical protein